MNIRHILVATDLSQEAMSCIPDVAGLARTLGARITLLHVMEAFDAIPHGSPLAPPLRLPEDMRSAEEIRAELEERRASYGSDLDIDVAVLTGGDVAKEIANYAEANDMDLIAMTTHGRTGFRRLALGSVAEATIRHSRVPVLVLPLPKD